ncbi:MAG TPA: hypothetical protein PKD37_06900 [Oligoflexia bacterium]|nr:hypothetical protein [Oligoflexia bacterium]HMP27691.1 hypothetical protein [Oligoflexia bacterium]
MPHLNNLVINRFEGYCHQFCNILLGCLLSLVLTTDLFAQFISTGIGVWQDPYNKVISFSGNDRDGSGVFIFHSEKDPLPIGAFDPAQVIEKESLIHLALTFNNGRFDTIRIGQDKRFAINGSFDLKIGGAKKLTLSLDYLNNYLTVVSEGDATNGESVSILGFSGVSNLFNFSGRELVSLLQANQFKGDIGLTYQLINSKGDLKLGNLTVDGIGAPISPEPNPCLASGALILTQANTKAVTSAPSTEKQIKILKDIAAKQKREKRSPLSNLIHILINNNRVVSLDLSSGIKITLLTRVPELADFESALGEITICSLKSVI